MKSSRYRVLEKFCFPHKVSCPQKIQGQKSEI